MPTAPRRPSAQARSFTSLCECNDTKARQAFRHLDSEFTPEISTYIKLQSMRLTLGGAGRGRVALLRDRRCSDRRPRSSLSLIPAFLCGCSRFLDVPRRTRGSVQTGYIVNRCSGTSLTCITLLMRVRERSRDLVGWAGDRHAKSSADQAPSRHKRARHPPSIFSVWCLICAALLAGGNHNFSFRKVHSLL